MTKIYLQSPHDDKNYMLVMESSDSVLLNTFRGQGFATLPQTLRPFLQIDCADCKGWEFWSKDVNAILDASMAFANLMGLTLDIV